MRIINKEELSKILKDHKDWLNEIGDSRANLWRADLRRADLREADLRGADLRRADLQGADLREANLMVSILGNFSIVPEKGEFTGFKRLKNGVIAELLIPQKAKRIGGLLGRKCRAGYVKVLRLYALAGNKCIKEAFDTYKGETKYKVNEIVRPDSFDCDIRLECTNGIHFVLTRKEAEEYS